MIGTQARSRDAGSPVDRPLTFADDFDMWFIAILTLLSAALPQYDFINIYRLSFGWAQLGVFEIGLAIGLVYALIKGGDYAQRYPSMRTSPVLMWLMVLFTLATIAGTVGSFGGLLPAKYKVAAFREFASLPICIIIGYRLLSTPRQMLAYAYVTILAGVLTSIGVLLYFNSEAEVVQVTGKISALRGTVKQFTPEFASCAGLLLLWSISSGQRLLRTGIALCIALFCFVGYLGMLGRTHMVVMVGAAIALLWIIPRNHRVGSAIKLMVTGPIVVFALYGALVAGGKIVGRENFVEKITTHFATLLPSERHIGENKAWDGRLGSIVQEFQLWLRSPLYGNGFMSQEGFVRAGEIADTGAYNHNGWTSALAKTGIIGFSAVFLMIMTTVVLGYRLVRDNLDRTFVVFGAVGFIVGTVYLIRASCSMGWASRPAIHFATVCGMMIRAREMEQTIRAMRAAPVYEANVDPDSGLLITDYQAPAFGAFGGFESAN